MDLTCEHFRAMIYYDFRCGLTQKQYIDQLTSTFGDGDGAPSKTTVHHWFNEFNRERSVLKDEFKEGRLESVIVPYRCCAGTNNVRSSCYISRDKGVPGHKDDEHT
ncbi:hypothetical protein EVAR_41816_1 [Eumeta japonica]|uniref:Mos1 transposase HTH domain-containing protein n=1 Tax=Eumeta variegata TaxID=151549 RepID=A0A4C1XCT9_EUMVA|nr:hypothetical protein EVAR_41816_1 [Eumeta japonica]